jgi:hypothetical protein
MFYILLICDNYKPPKIILETMESQCRGDRGGTLTKYLGTVGPININ